MTRRRTARTSEQQTDALISEIFGVSGRADFDRLRASPFERLWISLAIQIIDGAMSDGVDIARAAATWMKEDLETRHAGGRPASISTRSLLIVMLMHALARESFTFRNMANTLASRLDLDQLAMIGLPAKFWDADVWYRRLDSAHKLFVRSIDTHPYPTYPGPAHLRPPVKDRITRHRKLTAVQRVELAQFHEENADIIATHEERLLDFMTNLVGNTVRMAKPVMSDFNGNIAQDATFTPIFGKYTSRSDLSVPARSTTPEAGMYRRGGDHNGESSMKRKEVRKFGVETDVITTTFGRGHDAPDLILAIALHNPGMITKVAGQLYPRLMALGLPVGTLSVDRAYNNLLPENFHEPLLRHGYEFVFDYPKTELGQQHAYASGWIEKENEDGKKELVRDRRVESNNFIMVEGTWYLGFMPELLVSANKEHRKGLLSDEKRDELVARRTKYQLFRHGLRDEDGYQRYHMPDPKGYVAVDPITQKLVAKPNARTVTIPMSEGIRWAQKYPFGSQEWRDAYNLRSTVERKNAQLKHPSQEDLNNPAKRQIRGFTPTAVAIALLTVAHNIHAIDYHLASAEGLHLAKNKRRATRPKQRPHGSRIEDTKKPRDGRKAA